MDFQLRHLNNVARIYEGKTPASPGHGIQYLLLVEANHFQPFSL